MTTEIQMNLDFDKKHIWHPYSSITQPGPIYPVASAKGVHITLEDGRQLIDGMSSWWCALHGYNHPVLNQALTDQAQQFAHVMFGGFTHQPAISLCEKLVQLTPEGLTKVFLADSGSVAVEVALKMAIQYWHSRKRPEKGTILSFKRGYHGDTFGAMSTCDPDTGMHHLFKSVLSQQIFMSEPPAGIDTPVNEQWLKQLETLMSEQHKNLAAMIIEPVVQGAGGMRFYNPAYLGHLRRLCDHYSILLITDEIATGFGRTGQLFGCNQGSISPDILCLGKALTGGYMTMAATLCTDTIANTISDAEPGVFMHGPTFMGNALACAVANASIDLLLSSDWQTKVKSIETQLASELEECQNYDNVASVRTLGAIGVIEMKQPVILADIQPKFVEQGIWLRPFGKLIYTMPPFITSPEQLSQLTSGIKRVLTT